jgi:hypothetical protein
MDAMLQELANIKHSKGSIVFTLANIKIVAAFLVLLLISLLCGGAGR